mmetsp:Transcript_11115/g.16856  ORF Transcript_11115/g.16856 Transcript_11115/m.16856 type:complete len:99 (+) Transcript_11115:1564-1860(+)
MPRLPLAQMENMQQLVPQQGMYLFGEHLMATLKSNSRDMKQESLLWLGTEADRMGSSFPPLIGKEIFFCGHERIDKKNCHNRGNYSDRRTAHDQLSES